MTVIELGFADTGPPVEIEPARPWSLRRLRPAALALALLLSLGLGGSGPPPPAPLVLIGDAPTGPDGNYLLTRDLLFVSYLTPDRTTYLLAAYDLRDGRQRWQARQEEVLPSFNLLQQTGDLLLSRTLDQYSVEPRTTAFDAGSGAVRWSVPYAVTALDDGRTGVATTHIPPPPPERLGTSDWQIRYEGHTLDGSLTGAKGIDLATGEVLWSVPRLAHIGQVVSGPESGPALLAIPEHGPIEVWDARTRSVRHRLPVPADGPAEVDLVGELLMVQAGQAARQSVHERSTLRPVWSEPPARTERSVGSCGSMLCRSDVSGFMVLDPATGHPLWSTRDRPVLIEEAGHLIEFSDGQLVRTVDPRTGRTLVDLAGWQVNHPGNPASAATGPVPLLLSRSRRPAEGVWFAVLDPKATAVWLLGSVPHLAVNCHAGPADRFVCQTTPSEIRIWRYRR